MTHKKPQSKTKQNSGMRCCRMKQTFLVLLASTILFMYLVLAANYVPVLFMSFSTKLYPASESGLPLDDDYYESNYQNLDLGLASEGGTGEDGFGMTRAVILWTTWRSGSTFLGNLLTTGVRGTFYSAEPLHYWKMNILHENDTRTNFALNYLHDLLYCRLPKKYQKQVEYLSHQDYYLRANSFLYRQCRPQFKCGNRNFVSSVCQRANIHILKVMRLSLKWAWSLLRDSELDLQIIYVARDPRAVLLSRAKVGWCQSETCRKPKMVCNLLEDDLKEAQELLKTFPEKFKFMQYESLGPDPEVALRVLMDFIQVPVNENQLRLLRPLITNPDSLYSIKKNPVTQIQRWRKMGSYETVNHIQKFCMEPLTLLGLPIFGSKTELRNLSIPLLSNKSPFNDPAMQEGLHDPSFFIT